MFVCNPNAFQSNVYSLPLDVPTTSLDSLRNRPMHINSSSYGSDCTYSFLKWKNNGMKHVTIQERAQRKTYLIPMFIAVKKPSPLVVRIIFWALFV